jgi:signal transduction histidine kinase
VCLFDQQFKLTYRNNAMNAHLQQPMLLGSTVTDLGFTFNNGHFTHAMFDQKWQSQSIHYLNKDQKHWLFSAIDISALLNQNQTTTEKNLVRVLAHELRNSLTPMASMADTLLCTEQLDEAQTRLVLSRIQQRSERLLTFIGEYSQLTHLPPPKYTWFDLTQILAEAKSMIPAPCHVTFQGAWQCYGDENQVSHIMINLLKNAQEANQNGECEVNIKLYQQQQMQVIEFTDNGPGFANLTNVLTPFYTTKNKGSGIGLSLCDNICRNHQGQLKVTNQVNTGAMITMTWPV